MHGMRARGTRLAAAGAVFMVMCTQSEAAIGLGESLAKNILVMDSPAEFSVVTAFIFVGYMFQYVMTAGVFEYTHPDGAWRNPDEKKKADRWLQVTDELHLGVYAMLTNVFFTMLWMRYGEPNAWTYGYFDSHDYTLGWFLASIPMYLFCFDTWFYITHRWMHESQFLWDKVHRIHHGFKHPSAFAQDAAHPFEAAIQGPVGHYMVTLFFPVHPVAHAAFGFLASVFAIAAHDGRVYDLNNHYFHHDKGRGKNVNFNYGLFTPFWDVVCGTRWVDTPENRKKLGMAAPETWTPNNRPMHLAQGKGLSAPRGSPARARRVKASIH